MNITDLIVQLVAGAVGGNLIGSLLKKYNLGPVGNSIAGIVGGVGGGQILGLLAAHFTGVPATGASGGMDASSIISSLVGGGVGGGVLMAIVGMVRSKMGGSSQS
jgi:uncharacterized membrane protein YeaQ/YmgE (transglycosylase-associated protein family)